MICYIYSYYVYCHACVFKEENHPLQLDGTVRKYLRMDGELLKLLLRLGIPASINMILVSLSEIAVIAFVNRYGSDATAATAL